MYTRVWRLTACASKWANSVHLDFFALNTCVFGIGEGSPLGHSGFFDAYRGRGYTSKNPEGPKGETFSCVKNRSYLFAFFLSLLSLFFLDSFLLSVFFFPLKLSVFVLFALKHFILLFYVIWAFAFALLSLVSINFWFLVFSSLVFLIKKISEFQFKKI